MVEGDCPLIIEYDLAYGSMCGSIWALMVLARIAELGFVFSALQSEGGEIDLVGDLLHLYLVE
jgi:hypothetical protein